MEKTIIKDFYSLKKYFRTIERPFFALNKYPYSTLIGIEKFINNFQVLAFLNSNEAELIAKKNKILLFMDGKIRGEIKGEDYPDMNSIYGQIGKDENRQTISILKDEKIINYLQGFKENPVLLVYRMSEGLVKTFKNHDWTIVGSDYDVRKKYDNKIYFNKILEEINLPVPRYIIISQEEIDYNNIVKSLGDKIVIQFPNSYSGSGTFIIYSEEDFNIAIFSERFLKQKNKNLHGKIRITKYVNRKLSPVMGVCCTKEGIVYTDYTTKLLMPRKSSKKKRAQGSIAGTNGPVQSSPRVSRNRHITRQRKLGLI